MKWRSHGVVWQPDGSLPWARSHASCPTPVWLSPEHLRVYVQCRDANNVGRVGYVDLDPSDPRRVLAVSETPVLDVGEAGAFDDNGVFQASIVRVADGRLFMYYVGFELCHHIRYRLLTGLAISTDNGNSFQRWRNTPVLERSHDEPHFRCGPWALQENGRFRMWYVAGGAWERIEGKDLPIYDLRYIESADGLHWPERGEVVLAVNMAAEHGFGRPMISRDSDGYRMHYSIRRRNPARYGLGFARSADGRHWQREDASLGLEAYRSAWESEAVEYSCELQAGGKTWLLYNGNDFGGTGFGIAELIEP